MKRKKQIRYEYNHTGITGVRGKYVGTEGKLTDVVLITLVKENLPKPAVPKDTREYIVNELTERLAELREQIDQAKEKGFIPDNV